MKRRIFISYNFNDRLNAHNIGQFFQPEGGKCQGKPLFVENDVSSQGEKAIDTEIKSVMDKCKIALFIVGNDVHNSPWIDREAELAVSKNICIAAIRYPNTNGGLPNFLAEREIPIVKWDQNELAKVLNKMGNKSEDRKKNR